MEKAWLVVGIIVAAIACILSLIAVVQVWKKTSMVEGRHLQEVTALKEKVSALEAHETKIDEMAGDIREIKADIKWLKKERNSWGE
jgi:Tfp pilus assembly protein PilE